MKYIKLSKGQEVIIDDEDFDFISKYKWHDRGGKIPYICRSIYRKGKNPKSEYLHRMLMKPNSNQFVDHINGNTFDNRRENLRLLSNKENCRNRTKLNKNNKSGYRGVCWFKATGKWFVQVVFNKKRVYTGFFEDKIEAALKYNEIVLKYCGESAKLNVV